MIFHFLNSQDYWGTFHSTNFTFLDLEFHKLIALRTVFCNLLKHFLVFRGAEQVLTQRIPANQVTFSKKDNLQIHPQSSPASLS